MYIVKHKQKDEIFQKLKESKLGYYSFYTLESFFDKRTNKHVNAN